MDSESLYLGMKKPISPETLKQMLCYEPDAYAAIEVTSILGMAGLREEKKQNGQIKQYPC